MKKADPVSRIFCKNMPPAAGAPPGSRSQKCQNATMALFAERLQNLAPGLNWPVQDATGLDGAWDLTLTFSMRPMMTGLPRPPEATPAAAAIPMASEPSDGYTIFEALEKELGLKLEKQKRKMPVIVIDHIEQRPTEN